MTLFEYLTAAVSIVLALAVVRLVEGLRPAVDSDGRYWVHWGWVVGKIVSCLIFWWTLWGAREGVAWNFPSFAFVFIGPIILYMQASVLVPQNPASIASWREYFFSIHRSFYIANALLLAHMLVSPLVLAGILAPMPGPIVLSLGCIASIVGAVSNSVRVQEVLAPVMFATIILGALTLFFEPISAQIR
jgi:hypothetical protein